jgi:hypothetical protein
MACSGNLPPPSPPREQAAASDDEAGEATANDGAWHQLASDFTTGIVRGVNVKISEMGL